MAVPQPKPQPETESEKTPSNDPPVQPVPTEQVKPKQPLIGSYVSGGVFYKPGDTVYPDRVAELDAKARAASETKES